jgi:hypothetical protein
MRFVLQAGVAFVLAALITGQMPPLSPRWQAVKADLHQAQPQVRLKAQIATLVSHKES